MKCPDCAARLGRERRALRRLVIAFVSALVLGAALGVVLGSVARAPSGELDR